MSIQKRCIIAAVLMLPLLLSVSAKAQFYELGVRGGVNLSTLSNTDSDHYETGYDTGYHFSVFLNVGLFRLPVAIQPEVTYTRLGMRYDGTPHFGIGGPGQHPDATLRIEYVQIPVLLKYYFPVPGFLDPNLFAGPYLGFRAGGEYTYPGREEGPLEIDNLIRENDYGLILGAGTEVRLLVTTVHLEARFTVGLENVYESFFDNGEKNRAITFSAGFVF